MRVDRLEVVDFRSWPAAELLLDPGINVLVGPNGQGKTNLLEAIGYAATLGSHRVATDAPLIRAGSERSVVRVEVTHAGRAALLEVEVNAGRANRARINRAPARRVRDVLGWLRTVLFAPEDLALVRGDPGERRRFLDDLLVARTPRFAGVRADYDRIVRQRTALLKSAAGRSLPASALRTLDVWDGSLADTGGQLLAGRLRLVAALAPLVQRAGRGIGGPHGPELRIGYRSTVETAPAVSAGGGSAGGGSPGGGPVQLPAGDGGERPVPASPVALPSASEPTVSSAPEEAVLSAALLAEFARRRDEEVARGSCLVGPHRDDLELHVAALPARGHASHGEGWSLALALRLASYDLLREDGFEPVLLLDDVFAELDAGRRDRLAQLVGTAEQVICTAAVAEDVPLELTGARYDVMDGVIKRVR